jgi:Fic family protein
MDWSSIECASMPTLQQQIATLANSFTQEVLAALRGVSMAELSEFSPTTTARGRGRPAKKAASVKDASKPAARKEKAGRLARRSPKQLANTVEKIVSLLKGKKAGLRSEEIQGALGLSRKEMPRPIQAALAKKLIRRKGQKRGTTYFTA